MAVTAVRIEDGIRQMILRPRSDIRLQEIDVPYPAVREDADDATDDDGTDDSTEFFSARAASVELLALSGPRAVEDELAGFMHPRSRPYLVVTDDEWSGPRRLRLRADQGSWPIGVDLAPYQRRIKAQWKVPSGVWEAAEQSTVTVTADISSNVGMPFPLALPVAFTATQATGAVIVDNPGSTPSHFTARLYGPCTAPRLVNETTGEQIAFLDSLSLSAGDYVEVDTRARSAYLTLNGSAAQVGRLDAVDFALTQWWRLEPGTQVVRYAPPLAGAGAAAVIDYRACWL